MEEKIFVGFAFGRFCNDRNEMQDYCNVYVLEEFTAPESQDYHRAGQKATKYGCVSPDVFKDIKPNTRVQCYFDSRKRVAYMVPVSKG